MMKKFILLFSAATVCFAAFSQTYNVPYSGNSSVTGCSGTIYDNGGPNIDYSYGCYGFLTLTNPGGVNFNFTLSNFRTESGYDVLTVYDGPTETDPILVQRSGFYPGNFTFSSTSSVVLIHFGSDNSIEYNGFQLAFSTSGGSGSVTADFNAPAGDVPLNWPAQFTFTGTSGVGTRWNFGDGQTSTDNNPTNSFQNPGVYSVKVVASNCANSDSISKNVTVAQAPIISFDPSSVNATILGCNDSAIVAVKIKNTGIGPLVFDGSTSTKLEDFENGADPEIWDFIIGGVNQVGCPESGNFTKAIYFNDYFERTAQTKPLDFSNSDSVRFDLYLGGSSYGCEIVDQGLEVYLYYTTDGSNYVLLSQDYNLGNLNFITKSVYLPPAARTATTQLRWFQPSFYTEGYDTWAIDNLRIDGRDPSVQMSPATGNIPADDSLTVNIKIYSAGLAAGSYNTSLNLLNNDPANGNLIIPVSFTIVGTVALSTDKNCIDFGTIQQNALVTDTIILSNISCADAFISSSSTTNPNFFDSFGSGTITTYSNDTVIVSFQPSSVGSFEDTLTFYNSDTLVKVCLRGISVPAPVFDISPDSLQLTINSCNDSVLVPVKIYNTGLGPLNFYLDSASFSGSIKILLINADQSSVYPYYQSLKNTILAKVPGAIITETSNTNPTFLEAAMNQNDIVIVPPNGQGNGYNYGFYTAPAFSNYVNSGGKVLVLAEDDFLYSSNLIGGFYNYTMSTGDQFTINIPSSPLLAGVPTPIIASDYVAALEVYSGGAENIITYFNYYAGLLQKTVGLGKVAYVAHTFNANNNSFNQIVGNIIKSSKNAVSWLSSDTYSGTVAPNDSITLMVKVKSTGLASGAYRALITINTNDPTKKIVDYPVNLIVDGDPIINLSAACLNFGSVMEKTKTVLRKAISNTGCDSLRISSFVSGNPAYSVSPTSITIAPGASDTVDVTFYPTSVGSYSTNIVVYNNDLDTIICVSGTATPAPIISANPSSLTVNLGSCDADSTLVNFSLLNTGQVPLIWSSESGIKLTDDFDNGTFNPAIWTSIGDGEVSTMCASYINEGLQFHENFRQAVTKPFQVSGGSLSFYFKYSGCDTPESGEEMFAAYTTDGSNWVNFMTFNTSIYQSFTLIDLPIPVAAFGPNTSFKLYQPNFSGSLYDTWTVDNFELTTGYTFSAVNPGSGTIPASSSTAISAYIHNGGLNGGTYSDTLYFATNDPVNPVFKIPITKIISSTACADFGSTISGCTGTVLFSDSTKNPGSSFTWNFGDGGTSTQKNPSHTYSMAGVYSVQLISCNGQGCDTIVKDINLTVVGAPKPACVPYVNYTCCGYGVLNVKLNTIDNTSLDANQGYEDFTCSDRTQLYTGQTYNLAVRTGGYEDVYVWFDFNDDGIFSTSERTALTRVDNYNLKADILMPTTAVLNKPLRVRIESFENGTNTPNSCGGVTYGQYEDYSVVISDYLAKPSAKFQSLAPNICDGKVNFTDQSTNVPTLWLWSFGDGQFSNLQNPQHTYAAAGVYSVQLKASNVYGTDSLRKSVTVSAFTPVINMVGAPKLGSPIQFSATGGNIIVYNWDFGDGGTSTLATPSHTFITEGWFEVKLTAINDIGCQSIAYKYLDITVSSISAIGGSNGFKIYPNPVTEFINLEIDKTILVKQIEVLDLSGRLISTIQPESSGTYQIPVSELSKGNYVLRITSTNGVLVNQFSKQ